MVHFFKPQASSALLKVRTVPYFVVFWINPTFTSIPSFFLSILLLLCLESYHYLLVLSLLLLNTLCPLSKPIFFLLNYEHIPVSLPQPHGRTRRSYPTTLDIILDSANVLFLRHFAKLPSLYFRHLMHYFRSLVMSVFCIPSLPFLYIRSSDVIIVHLLSHMVHK